MGPSADWILARTVVLIGMPGSGKTAVGRALARMLDADFVDCDDEIVAAANMSIPEIFARYGETFFRDRESEVLARLLNGSARILSTGGGAWMQPRNRALIADRGVALWLDADLDTLWSRVRGRDTRPLLAGPDGRARLAALYAERHPVYATAALRIDASGHGPVGAQAALALALLANAPSGPLRRRKADE
jgi:shikimate kinase